MNFLRLLPVPRLGTYGSSTCLYICRKPPTHLASLLFSVHTVGYTSLFPLCMYAKLCEERTFKFRIGSVMNICIRSWSIYFKFFMHTYSCFPHMQVAIFNDLLEATVVYITYSYMTRSMDIFIYIFPHYNYLIPLPHEWYSVNGIAGFSGPRKEAISFSFKVTALYCLFTTPKFTIKTNIYYLFKLPCLSCPPVS